MTNPTPHGQVPEALIDLIDEYAETRHRCGGIYNARTEAARKAVIEALSGVQALSAAPAEQQAAPKAAPGDVLDESLRERDDAEDFIDALLDEVLGHERPEWSSSYGRADALNDVQERMTALHKPAVDKAWGRFQSAMAAPQQEAREAAPGESLDECFPGESRVAVPQGLISAACFAIRNKRDGGKVLEQLRRYSVGDLSQPLAPQQEAQEPVAWQGVHDQTDLYYTKPLQADVRPLYAAPRPAPAPAPLSDDVVRDAARWRMVALIGNEVMLHPEKRTQAAAVKAYMDATHSGSDLTGAVDAALAAQRGNK